MKYTKQQIQELLDGIYAGTITVTALPKDLYFAIADYLKDALYEGFGGSLSSFSVDSVDYSLLSELRANIYMFSAAKTYSEVAAMVEMVAATETFSQFKKEALKVYEQYNVDWLKSEYNTTIAQGEMAQQWVKIEKDAALFPLLRYDTTEVACPICAPLNGVVRPYDDIFWSTYYPPNHFNCMCVVLQERDVRITQAPPQTADKMQDVFKMNVGKDKYVFSPQHPYFQTAPKTLGLNNFGLEIPEND